MSVDLVRRATALTNSDVMAPDEELEELFTPDVVLDLNARIFNPKVYEGYDGLREFYAESREVWEQVTLTIHEIIAESDRYVVLGDGRSRGRGSGIGSSTTSSSRPPGPIASGRSQRCAIRSS